jgi:hypothetical protein
MGVFTVVCISAREAERECDPADDHQPLRFHADAASSLRFINLRGNGGCGR